MKRSKKTLTSMVAVALAFGGLAAVVSEANAGGRPSKNVTHTNINNNNRNTNVNVNKHVDVDIDRDNHRHPVGTAVAVGATVAVTAAVVGSIVNTVPSNCVPVQMGPTLYQQCGQTWYQPQYAGTNVQYVVVTPPR